MSGQGLRVVPALMSPTPALLPPPSAPGFVPVHLLGSWAVLAPGLLGCSPGGMGSKVGAQRGWDGAGVSPDPPSPCVPACTALQAARTSTGTSGAIRVRATGT